MARANARLTITFTYNADKVDIQSVVQDAVDQAVSCGLMDREAFQILVGLETSPEEDDEEKT